MSESVTQVFQRHALGLPAFPSGSRSFIYNFRATDDAQALPLLICSLVGAAVISSYALSFASMLKQWAFGGISVSLSDIRKDHLFTEMRGS